MLVISGVVIVLGILQQHFFCFYGLGNSTIHYDGCILGKYADIFVLPVFLISVSLFFTLLFTFFISGKIFKRWLKFGAVWLIITTVFIVLAPENDYRFFSGPTKVLVSVWMSTLFFIISIFMFAGMSVYKKRHKNFATSK